MSFQNFWSNYKVLIVMLPLVGFIHLGWHRIKSSPVFQMPNKDVSAPHSPALERPEKNHIKGK